MEKHEREKMQSEIASVILPAVLVAVENSDWDQAKKLMKLYNSVDRGW